jgi:hypothetical protein
MCGKERISAPGHQVCWRDHRTAVRASLPPAGAQAASHWRGPATQHTSPTGTVACPAARTAPSSEASRTAVALVFPYSATRTRISRLRVVPHCRHLQHRRLRRQHHRQHSLSGSATGAASPRWHGRASRLAMGPMRLSTHLSSAVDAYPLRTGAAKVTSPLSAMKPVFRTTRARLERATYPSARYSRRRCTASASAILSSHTSIKFTGRHVPQRPQPRLSPHPLALDSVSAWGRGRRHRRIAACPRRVAVAAAGADPNCRRLSMTTRCRALLIVPHPRSGVAGVIFRSRATPLASRIPHAPR